MSYRIPLDNIEKFQAKIAKLNKIALKLGVSPVVVTRGEDILQEIFESDDLGRRHATGAYERLGNFTVEGIAPKLDGWKFVATLEVLAAGNLIRQVPGGQVPERYRTAKLTCEHCLKIRKRSNYFLVQDESDNFKSVGRSCLKDFLGHKDPAAIASYMELVFSLSENEKMSGSSRAIQEFPLSVVLTTALVYIRKHGFLSKKKMQELAAAGGQNLTTTSAQINYYLIAPWSKDEQDAWNEEHRTHQATDDDRALAADIKTWMLTLNATEFDHNLALLAKEGFVQTKHFGFIAAAAFMGAKHLDRLVIEKKKLADKSNKHVGTIGEKIKMQLTITKMREFDGGYGVSTLVSMEDAEGNAFQWWASKCYDALQERGFKEGEKLTISATVKKHGFYEDRAQTGLTRCKLTQR